MSDHDRRNLDRRARAGDTDAAAALKRADERAGPQCPHRVVSRRVWIAPGGVTRHDRFCLGCGVNMDRPGEENVTFDDCVPARASLRRLAKEEATRTEEAVEEQKERGRVWCAKVAADLRAEHEWLADVEDDQDVLDRYHSAIDAEGDMPW